MRIVSALQRWFALRGIADAGARAACRRGWFRISSMGLSRREISQVFRQLAVMLRAGLGLERSLEVLAAQTARPLLRQALNTILDQIRSGISLHEALAEAEIFPAIVPQMVQVGETGGVLVDVCYRISEYLEHEYEISNRVLAALAYPAIVFLFAVASVLGISFYIMPMFAELFASSGVPLPYLTVLVIKSSLLLKNYGLLMAVALIAAGFLVRRAAASARLAPAAHRGLLYVPVAGKVTAALASLQMTETMAVLLQAGVPALTALETAGRAVNNRYFRHIIADVCASMQAGRGIAASLAAYRHFDEMFIRMIAAGEESGSLSEMLTALSSHLQKDLLHKLDSMIAMLEPALILIVAFLVGTTVVATLLPMYSLMNVAAGI